MKTTTTVALYLTLAVTAYMLGVYSSGDACTAYTSAVDACSTDSQCEQADYPECEEK